MNDFRFYTRRNAEPPTETPLVETKDFCRTSRAAEDPLAQNSSVQKMWKASKHPLRHERMQDQLLNDLLPLKTLVTLEPFFFSVCLVRWTSDTKQTKWQETAMRWKTWLEIQSWLQHLDSHHLQFQRLCSRKIALKKECTTTCSDGNWPEHSVARSEFWVPPRTACHGNRNCTSELASWHVGTAKRFCHQLLLQQLLQQLGPGANMRAWLGELEVGHCPNLRPPSCQLLPPTWGQWQLKTSWQTINAYDTAGPHCAKMWNNMWNILGHRPTQLVDLTRSRHCSPTWNGNENQKWLQMIPWLLFGHAALHATNTIGFQNQIHNAKRSAAQF